MSRAQKAILESGYKFRSKNFWKGEVLDQSILIIYPKFDRV
jgi:hypothetical protein